MSGEVQEQSADYNLADLKPVLEKASGNNTLLDSLPIWLSAQTTKSAGRGRSAENTLQYGVQKLRGLILELAVRGKLVEQNLNDEPASILLEKIAEEKARLVKEGVAKKEKKLSSINEDEKPYAIPRSWHWARLPEVYISISPSGKKLKTSELKETGKYPVVDQGQSHIAGYFDDESLLIEIPNPVVVFGDHTKARKYIDFNFIPGADGTKILSPVTIFPRYFYLHLLSYNLEDRGYGRHFKILNSNLFAVPPLEEQHRIVKKVDELMALCDKLEQQQADAVQAHDTLVRALLDTLTQSDNADDFQQNCRRIAEHFDTLFTTESSIDQLKQTLLQLAVMGKLVPQAPNDEPASVLLEKIAQEKARLIKEGKIRKSKTLPPITPEESIDDIPDNWSVCRLNDIGTWGSGATPKRGVSDYYGGGIPWFKSGELSKDFINSSEETITEKALKESSVKLNSPGDVLIAMYGATIGKASILEVEATTNQAVCACSLFDGVSNLFLLLLLKAYKARFIGMGAGGAQPNISREKIIATVIALPPLAEQHRIVKKVDELMMLCDQLKDRLNRTQILKQKLADAVSQTI